MEDNFHTDQGEDDFGMIQAHYNYLLLSQLHVIWSRADKIINKSNELDSSQNHLHLGLWGNLSSMKLVPGDYTGLRRITQDNLLILRPSESQV